jgi:hypothetical protein
MDSPKKTSYRLITSYLSGTIFTTTLENLQLERSKLIEFKIVCLNTRAPEMDDLHSTFFTAAARIKIQKNAS